MLCVALLQLQLQTECGYVKLLHLRNNKDALTNELLDVFEVKT